ncbi:hypothetical protein CCHL11_03656 [Colletotrichum chlorophyti]|uniref:Uncharacterized protein n=1 Tax=Colletotrichum chlorophyti TaxID=708187 RepID=A0A1Q8RS80_9PEZI|nr:hypothetical protein CCHL11_03656 [Colletotrichum chlorophyti]
MLVEISMDPNHYSAEKLLALRGSKGQTSFEHKLLDDAKENRVLSGILRHKHNFSRQKKLAFSTRNNSEARKSSSGDFNGQVMLKAEAPPAVAQLHDQTLPKSSNHIPQEVNQLDGEAGRQLDGQDADCEDQYEAPQRPTLPDQKRKGFEQFYEAVRSPTHVRVTAGGRIVPNTLDASNSSPTGKGSRDRLNGGLNGFQAPNNQAFNSAHFLPGHPMLGPLHPAVHPAFPIMAPGPGAMSPFGGFPIPPFALSQVPSQTTFSHPVGSVNPSNNIEEKTKQDEGPVSTSAPLPMPPFSGQWFLPPHPMMPMGMQFSGAPMMPVGFGPMGQPIVYPQPLQPTSATGPRPFASTVQAESCPVSSIRPSIITKNQLSGLRSSLKKAEAQLAYNRHQIDEKHMEEYARQLRSDIEHFEIKLKGELALEDNSIAPRKETTEKVEPTKDPNELKTTTGTRKKLFSLSFVGAEAMKIPTRTVSSKTPDEPKTTRPRRKDRAKLEVDTSLASAPFIHSGVFPAVDINDAIANDAADDLRKPSGLPVSAALAPVFQPRPSARPSDNTPPVSAVTKENHEGGGNRFFGPIPANLEESRYLSSVAPPTPAHDVEEFSNFARDNAGLGLPYLVGEVPFGMDPSPDIRDYIYHRPLTQDEEMAKHLFWSDAPEHLRHKFPKFDGKDFFPASPEKKPRPLTQVGSNLPTGRPEEDYGFSLPSADLDPFAPLEPYREVTHRPVREPQLKDLKRDTKSDNVTSPMKRREGNKLRLEAYFNSQGLNESKDSSGSSDSLAETESERAYFNSCVRTWSERVTAAATALPGTVTSENAKGYLPQYAIGHAAASLSPAIFNTVSRSSRLSPSTLIEHGKVDANSSLFAGSAGGQGENQPPSRFV